MSRLFRGACFLLGAAALGLVVARIGPARLVADAARTGWLIVPIVLVCGVVYLLDTHVWLLTMAGEPVRPSFWQAYAILVAGFALNFVTPMVNAGGEPYKIAALGQWLGLRRAAGSVVLHTMVRVLTLLLVWITALVGGLLLLPRRPALMAGLVVALVLLGGLAVLLLAAHRRGGLERALDLMSRLPLFRRAARWLEPRRSALRDMDRQITAFYHQHPERFARAVALEYLSRCLFMLEFCLIGLSVGVPVGYAAAFVIGGLEALITNLLFFVPFEVGTREISTYALFQLLGFPGSLGLYAALVNRVRDLLWIAAGLLLLWVGGRRPLSAAAGVPPAPESSQASA